MEKIAAIIPTINRKEVLRKCLDTLGEQTFKNFSIYVVNNGSKDSTEEFLKREYPNVTSLNFKQMLGSAGAYKKGLEQAFKDGADWFWLMDDDVWTKDDALEKLVITSKLDAGKVFASVCMDEKMTGDMAWTNDLVAKQGEIVNAKTYKDLGKDKLVESNGIGYLGLFLPRNVVEKVGYPDETMFAWVDDVDYYLRIKEKGYRMYYVRESLIYHPKADYQEINLGFKKIDMARTDPWKEYYAIRNSVYVWLKHGNRIKTIFLKIPKQILLYLVVLLFYRDQKIKRFHYYFLGFYHGISSRMGLVIRP